jgi:HAD superfamily hydrolase (TIGR01509 family)
VPGSTVEPVAAPAGRLFDAVVFDLDGVIVDTERVILEVWREAFARYGGSFTPEEWAAGVGTDRGFDPFATLAERSRRPLPERSELQDQIELREQVLLHGLSPLPGIREWIDGAERLGLGIAVASSSPAAWVTGRLADVGLDSRFVVVSCRSDKLAAKPAPDLYLDACRRLHVEPARAVAVEDSTNGLTAARAAGLASVAVPNSVTRHHDLSSADLLVESLATTSIEDALRLLSDRRVASSSRYDEDREAPPA